MTELNVQQLNEVAFGACTSMLEQAEDGILTDEQLLGELYGRLVAAHSLGWDIVSMTEDAKIAGDRLIEAAEEFESSEVEG
jgi:hypothetical protein